MVEQISPNSLWQFSLTLYPKIEPICLFWQDNFNANVNLLLLLCYLEHLQHHISQPQLQQLSAELLSLSRTVTLPIRTLRRQAQNHQLKQALLDAELIAEQLEQQQLCESCPLLTEGSRPLLEKYLEFLQIPVTPALQQQLFDLRQHL